MTLFKNLSLNSQNNPARLFFSPGVWLSGMEKGKGFSFYALNIFKEKPIFANNLLYFDEMLDLKLKYSLKTSFQLSRKLSQCIKCLVYTFLHWIYLKRSKYLRIIYNIFMKFFDLKLKYCFKASFQCPRKLNHCIKCLVYTLKIIFQSDLLSWDFLENGKWQYFPINLLIESTDVRTQ